MSGKHSLAELAGSHVAGAHGHLTLSQLPHILGDSMPDLPRDQVGRHRLVRALRDRFGANFRSIPGVHGLIQQFDHEVELEIHIARLKALKAPKPKEKRG